MLLKNASRTAKSLGAVLVIVFLMSKTYVHAQQLQQGISVQMATTSNATPMPEADENDAWIVTVTSDGRFYFGTRPVTSAELNEVMKTTPHHRDQNLYIKADARSPFADVERALTIARTNLFSSPVLLTTQPETPALGKLVAPKGLEVSVSSPGSATTIVEVTKSSQSAPDVRVDNKDVHLPDLQRALNQSLQKQNERVVVLRADGQLPFAQVAQVIDVCTSVKAKVAVAVNE